MEVLGEHFTEILSSLVQSTASTTLLATVCLAALVASRAADDFDEFDINADMKIDPLPVTPMSTGLEKMLHLGLVEPKIGPSGASLPPQPRNEVRDLSGWGPIGKMHPRLLAKDRMVRAYHNRMLDPRYTHLQGYGHQAQAPLRSQEKAKPSIGDRLAFF